MSIYSNNYGVSLNLINLEEIKESEMKSDNDSIQLTDSFLNPIILQATINKVIPSYLTPNSRVIYRINILTRFSVLTH